MAPISRFSRRQLLGLIPGLGIPALVTGSASASLARALSVVELARRSDSVAILTPLAARSQWETIYGRRRIVTYTDVRVDETLAGGLGSPLVVRTLGGRVGRDAQVVHGECTLLIGEGCLAFVRQLQGGVGEMAGMSQGHFPLVVAADGVRLRSNTRGFKLSGRGAVQELDGRTLTEARPIIQRAWNAR